MRHSQCEKVALAFRSRQRDDLCFCLFFAISHRHSARFFLVRPQRLVVANHAAVLGRREVKGYEQLNGFKVRFETMWLDR